MSARKKIILIVAILAVAGIAAFMYYRKNKGSKAYQQMLDTARQYIPGGFPAWLIRSAKEISPEAYYLIDGKATDASRMLAAYDSQYFGYGYEYNSGSKLPRDTGDEQSLHRALHSILQAEQAAS